MPFTCSTGHMRVCCCRNLFRVIYCDNDAEDLNEEELRQILLPAISTESSFKLSPSVRDKALMNLRKQVKSGEILEYQELDILDLTESSDRAPSIHPYETDHTQQDFPPDSST
jgi:hypothetical protein